MAAAIALSSRTGQRCYGSSRACGVEGMRRVVGRWVRAGGVGGDVVAVDVKNGGREMAGSSPDVWLGDQPNPCTTPCISHLQHPPETPSRACSRASPARPPQPPAPSPPVWLGRHESCTRRCRRPSSSMQALAARLVRVWYMLG